jgi:hypothetical protein
VGEGQKPVNSFSDPTENGNSGGCSQNEQCEGELQAQSPANCLDPDCFPIGREHIRQSQNGDYPQKSGQPFHCSLLDLNLELDVNSGVSKESTKEAQPAPHPPLRR